MLLKSKITVNVPKITFKHPYNFEEKYDVIIDIIILKMYQFNKNLQTLILKSAKQDSKVKFIQYKRSLLFNCKRKYDNI